MKSDYRECPACRVRIVWPITVDGVHLPAVDWVPDPAGTVAVQHTATGAWLGRVIEQGAVGPIFPEKRYCWHRETCQQEPSSDHPA